MLRNILMSPPDSPMTCSMVELIELLPRIRKHSPLETTMTEEQDDDNIPLINDSNKRDREIDHEGSDSDSTNKHSKQ